MPDNKREIEKGQKSFKRIKKTCYKVVTSIFIKLTTLVKFQ